jgi:hypothetical protein
MMFINNFNYSLQVSNILPIFTVLKEFFERETKVTR